MNLTILSIPRFTIDTPDDLKRVVIILIKPTSYDEDGYPYRFLRGVLPTNSLAVMYSLTQEALEKTLPSSVEVEIHAYEDGIKNHAKKLARLSKRFPEKGTSLIVGMVAVQTAQFPRARDLMEFWQQRGATCVIGGFHVSGSISTIHDGVDDPHRPGIPSPLVMPTEIQDLLDKGVVVFHGEAESLWAEALADILRGNPRRLYRGGRPELDNAPVPQYPLGYFENSFATRIGTFDTARGCPYKCSFCTVINVQGRKSRFRSTQSIVDSVKQICEECGSASFFFTDDNFARNPKWREILKGLIELKEQGHEISFMIEADLACHKIKGFLPMLAEAGCSQIFMGVESMNPKNLEAANKPQNQTQQFERLWTACHEHGIAVHAGYIIGFPYDTIESIRQDVEILARLGVDQASFFMLTPLPGSEDHVRAVVAGLKIDPDFNKYDSFHPIVGHPQMTNEEWFASYKNAWRQFYRVSNMITALKRFKSRRARQRLLRNFVWYRWSFAMEKTHPMIAGFYRFRDYRDRRPDAAPTTYPRHLLQEAWRHMRYLGRFLAEFYRFQHVVFETEYAPLIRQNHEGLTEKIHGVGDWAKRTFGEVMTRHWLNRFWMDYARKRWQLLLNPLTYRWHLYMLPHAFAEVIYTLRFAFQLRQIVKAAT